MLIDEGFKVAKGKAELGKINIAAQDGASKD